MAAVEAKTMVQSGRHYTAVTYLSSVVTLHPGEVAQISKVVTLSRPDGAIAVTQYMVELMLQADAELRPASASLVHLKQLKLQPKMHNNMDVTSTECTPQPTIFAGENGRGVNISIPHPYGMCTPNASDDWHASLHVIGTSGLALAERQLAQQCACMRQEIGSIHCCPHSCRFAMMSSAPARPQQFRISVMLTWLLASEADAAGSSARSTASRIIPVVSIWLPATSAGRVRQATPMACRGLSSPGHDELDLPPKCNGMHGDCRTDVRGPAFMLHKRLRLVATLPVLCPRILELQLVSNSRRRSKSAQGHMLCRCRADLRALSCASCQMPSAGNRAGGELLQALGTFNTSSNVRGAEAGWHLYVAASL
mmetsp:Transcript_6528/g.16885  ORF Transcript_6528/g.16885 Transcript_6528/m.16885 type:complete len:367 (-) Transcript_6528:259-1359(-)